MPAPTAEAEADAKVKAKANLRVAAAAAVTATATVNTLCAALQQRVTSAASRMRRLEQCLLDRERSRWAVTVDEVRASLHAAQQLRQAN